MPVDAVHGVSGGEVGTGSAYIEVLNGEILHGAVAALRSVNGNGLGVIGAAGAVGGVLDDAAAPSVDNDVAHIIQVNGAVPGPIGSREDRTRKEFYGDRSAGGTAAMSGQE